MMQSCHSLFLYALPLVLQLVHKNKKGMQVPYKNASNNLAPASKCNWGGNYGNLATGQPPTPVTLISQWKLLTLVLDLLHQWWVGGAITQMTPSVHEQRGTNCWPDSGGNCVKRDDPEVVGAKEKQLLAWPWRQLRQAWWSRGRKGEPGQKLISQLALIVNNLICFVEFGVFQLAFRFCDIIVYIHYDISSAFVGFSNDV